MVARKLLVPRETKLIRRWVSETVNLAYNSYDPPEPRDDRRRRPPVVLVHGSFGNKRNFAFVGRELARLCHTQVFAVDLRNHGDSPHHPTHSLPAMSADLARFIRDVTRPRSDVTRPGADVTGPGGDVTRPVTDVTRPVVLLGHSMGGRVVMHAANTLGAYQVCGLVIEDVSPVEHALDEARLSHSSPLHVARVLQTCDLAQYAGGLGVAGAKRAIDGVLAETVQEEAVRQFILTNLIRDTSSGHFRWRFNLDAMTRYLEAHYTRNASHELHFTEPVETPSLFIRGGRSSYVQDADVPTIKEMYPDSTIETIDDCGHWVHSQKPDIFLHIVSRFINGLTGS